MWAFLVSIVQLLLLIFKEFLTASAKAKAANEKFVLDKAQLAAIVDLAVEKWHDGNAAASQNVGNAWDQIDKDMKK